MNKTRDFRVFMCTWNVAEEDPPSNLTPLLTLDKIPLAHCYVIGLQEMKSSAARIVTEAFTDDPWTIKLTEALCHRHYVRVKSVRMLGIHLVVFVHREELSYVTNFESEYTRTGFGGLWGSKGGVSIRMDVHGVNVCFVNSHLAAHDEFVAERIMDFNTIVAMQTFRDPESSSIWDHDYVFWMGDLNFRLDNLTKEETERRIKNKELSSLWLNDQLQACKDAGLIFLDFNEGKLSFVPTYKFDKGTHNYDSSKKQRCPAWTDRILWKVHEVSIENVPLGVRQVCYTSRPNFCISDHKPVVSICDIKVLKSPPPSIMFQRMSNWSCDQDGHFSYVVNNDIEISGRDWIGLYRNDFKDFDEYVTFIWTPVKGEIRPDDSTLFKVKFSQFFLRDQAGSYTLCYYNKKAESMIGYSDPFLISLHDSSSSEESTSSSSSDWAEENDKDDKFFKEPLLPSNF